MLRFVLPDIIVGTLEFIKYFVNEWRGYTGNMYNIEAVVGSTERRLIKNINTAGSSYPMEMSKSGSCRTKK